MEREKEGGLLLSFYPILFGYDFAPSNILYVYLLRYNSANMIRHSEQKRLKLSVDKESIIKSY
jgi:hypothetical protein